MNDREDYANRQMSAVVLWALIAILGGVVAGWTGFCLGAMAFLAGTIAEDNSRKDRS